MTDVPAGTTLNIMKRYKTVDDYVANPEQWRMNSAKDIKPVAIKLYVKEAVQRVKDGKEIDPRKK